MTRFHVLGVNVATALVTMEERKEFWRYQKLQKWFRRNVGEHWIGKVLDKEEETHGIESRKKLGEYLLRMHQIETLMWMEQHPRKDESNEMESKAIDSKY